MKKLEMKKRQATRLLEVKKVPAFCRQALFVLVPMWYRLSDDLVLHILCFVPDAALQIVTRLNTLCHGFARERMSSLKRLTEKPFYVKTSDVFKNVLNLDHKELNYAGALVLATALCNGALTSLEMLILSSNNIGDAGLSALAEAVGKGALDKLTFLGLHGNKVGDQGMVKFSEALGKGALASLKALVLQKNQIGDAGMSALASACASGALDKLTFLSLESNQIGDQGMVKFSEALGKGALDHLTVCWRPTALSPCLETPHVHSPDSEHLFDVPYAEA